MRDATVDQIVNRVLAALRPEIEAIRQLVKRAHAPANDEPAGPLLTREELAAALRLSEATVKRWDRRGCPRVNLGDRAPRYRLADVLAWQKAAREQNAAPAPVKGSNVRILSRGRR